MRTVEGREMIVAVSMNGRISPKGEASGLGYLEIGVLTSS